MPTLPGYKYLGPGNKLKAGKPVNKVDRIARIHDYEYNKSRNKKQIFASDHKAIDRFKGESGFAARAGEYGLKAKNFVEEKILNKTIYPHFSGKYES